MILKLTAEERQALVQHLKMFNKDYRVSSDGDQILYGDDDVLSDRDALKDLYQWLMSAKDAAKFLNDLGFAAP